MIVTFNENSVTIQSDNLVDWTGYNVVSLSRALDCGETTTVELEENTVVVDSITLAITLEQGVHDFILNINKGTEITQERYVFFKNGKAGENEAEAKKALACDVLNLDYENAYLWFYILNEAACSCTPEHFCSLWARLKKLLYGDC